MRLITLCDRRIGGGLFAQAKIASSSNSFRKNKKFHSGTIHALSPNASNEAATSATTKHTKQHTQTTTVCATVRQQDFTTKVPAPRKTSETPQHHNKPPHPYVLSCTISKRPASTTAFHKPNTTVKTSVSPSSPPITKLSVLKQPDLLL